MLATAGVNTIKVDCRVISAASESVGGVSRVQSVTLHCEDNPITATAFIDASYDGDLMVALGNVDYTAGREATSKYNESLAGARAPSWSGVSGGRNVSAIGADGKIIKCVHACLSIKQPAIRKQTLDDQARAAYCTREHTSTTRVRVCLRF